MIQFTWNATMKKVALLIILLLVLSISYMITKSIMTEIKDQQKQKLVQVEAEKKNGKAPTTKIQPAEGEEKSPSTVGRVFVFLVLGAVLIFVVIMAYNEKRGTGSTVPWRDILAQPVFYAIVGTIVLNSFANLYIYQSWRWFWDRQVLFWGTNVGAVIFVHFFSKKEGYAKVIAWTLAFLTFTGFASELTKDKRFGSLAGAEIGGKKLGKGILSVDTIVEGPTYGVPASIALPIIADGETGNRKTGGAKHWFDEEKRIPMRNPQDGPQGTGAVGKWQINISDEAIKRDMANLEKEMLADGRLKPGEKLDVEMNEEHNRIMAEYLYEKYGTRPWLASRDYWEPLLKNHSLGRSTTIVVAEVPAGKWSETFYTRYNGGKTIIECRCRVKFNSGYSDQIEVDWPEAVGSSVIPKIVYNFQLSSRTNKPERATIKF